MSLNDDTLFIADHEEGDEIQPFNSIIAIEFDKSQSSTLTNYSLSPIEESQLSAHRPPTESQTQ